MYCKINGSWMGDNENGTYKNPILLSDYSDPDVIRVGSDFYMVASSFTYFPGLPVLHSVDLVNWQIINYAVDELPFKEYDIPQHGKGVWAPSIRYHNGKFYVYFATPDEGIFVSTTDDPYGKWDLKLVKKSCGWIDTCPFWDDDGQAYLIRGVAKSRIGYKSKLFLHKMSADGTELLDDGVLVFDGRINHPTIEGPKMYKRNGYYYIFAPAGGVQTGWQMEARSKNIYGPYEHKVVLHQGNSVINGPHQGAWVDTGNGEDWFVHFQDLNMYGRVTHLQPAKWVKDWLEIGVDTNKDNVGEPVLEYRMPKLNSCKKIYPLDCDDFTGTKLGLQWQFQAHLKKEFYELTGNGIKLFAIGNDGNNLSSVPNMMCQLMNRPNFTVTTKVKSFLEEGDSCGLVITGGSYYGLKITKINGKLVAQQVCFELTKTDDTFEKISGSATLDTDEIYMRIKVEYPNLIDSYISIDNKNYVKIGNTVKYEVSRKSWVGGKIGIYCTSGTNETHQSYAKYSYINVE